MSKVFTPLSIGDYELSHRIVMAPLTRYRAPNGVPGELMEVYYKQRASPGSLIIAESTAISPTSGNPLNTPRVDTPESIEGWKKVVDAVHLEKGIFFCQLNHYGRGAVPSENGNVLPISSSSIAIKGEKFYKPKEMDEDDMEQVIEDFTNAAEAAIKAGFDGVELHGANGYLLDQFVRDNINVRTDQYGGSIENRCKFPLKVLDSVIARIGKGKVGYRISPWDPYQDCKDSKPLEHFAYFCEQLEKRNIAYVHSVEERSDANGGRENDSSASTKVTVSALKKYLPTTPLISAGGWNDKNLSTFDDFELDAIAIGRFYISNPDLIKRLQKKLPLTAYDRLTFYSALDPKGYIDYPII